MSQAPAFTVVSAVTHLKVDDLFVLFSYLQNRLIICHGFVLPVKRMS